MVQPGETVSVGERAVAAVFVIIASAGKDRVISGIAIDPVIAVTAIQAVFTVAAIEQIIASIAAEKVMAPNTIDRVVASPPEKVVGGVIYDVAVDVLKGLKGIRL